MIGWDDALTALTPWESHGGRWYKREDYLAPLGYGSINGSKLRQTVWLLAGAHARGFRRVVTGASVLSPQTSMVAHAAAHLGLDATVMFGGTTRPSALAHPAVALARAAGATLDFTTSVGYNPALQRAVEDRAAHLGAYHVRYGISPDPDDVIAFHAVGAAQVANLPAGLRWLVVPCGSANSALSVLAGLADFSAAVERVTLIGIGPDRTALIEDRLRLLGAADAFTRLYHRGDRRCGSGPILVDHFDLHSAGIFTYADRRPFCLDGIAFHPTYEGKVLRFMLARRTLFARWWAGDGSVGLWIVGSEAT